MSTTNPGLPVLERLDRTTLHTVGDEWDSLLADSPNPSAYQAWPWVGAWLDTLGADDDVAVVAARDPSDGSFVGLAPFAVTTVRRRGMKYRALRLVGTGAVSATGLDLPIAGPYGDIIAPVLWDAVGRERRWDVLDLAGVAPDGVLARLVLRRRTDPAHAEKRAVRSLDLERLTPLAGDADVDGRPRLVVHRGDLDETFDSLVLMAEVMPGRRAHRAPMAHPSVIRFYREASRRLLAAGRLRLWRLDGDRGPLAALFGMRFGEDLACHAVLVDAAHDRSLTVRHLIAHAASAAAEEGARRFILPPGVDWPTSETQNGFDLRIRRPAGSWGRLLWLGRRVRATH